MAVSRPGRLVQGLRDALALPGEAGPTDARLLAEYLGGDEAALAALVRRHAAMVWGVCRRVLGGHDAEDAFQATFLVLVRRAASIASPELFANWLYGVAHRTALKARATRIKRWSRERQVAQMPEPATEQVLWDDLRPLLDRELSRLPAKYRVALVLCGLEGRTCAEAARELGVPDGTLAARLSRGRVMLAARLARRGLAVPAAALAAVLSRGAEAAAAPRAAAVRAALAVASPSAAAGLPARVLALADGAAGGPSWAGLKTASALVAGLGALALGLAAYPHAGARPQPDPPRPVAHPAAARPHPQRLQGEWVVVASELDGVKDFDNGRSHDRLVFEGDRVTYRVPKGPQEGRFRVDASKSPHEIDIEFDSGAGLKGIYEFDGPRLRFCWTKGGGRPASFDTSTGEMLTFLYAYEKKP